MSRILIIDDLDETRISLRAHAGVYDLVQASSLIPLETVLDGGFELILIDGDLPEGRGIEICKYLAKSGAFHRPPLFVLSSRSDIQDKLDGFAAGADDYIVKPFDARELQARIDSRLRRKNPEKLDGTGIKIDIKGVKVLSQEGDQYRNLNLTPNEFRILQILMGYEGKVVSRSELLAEGWGGGIHVLERTVDKHISSLRRKLGQASVFLQAVPGQGYRWTQD